MKYEVVRGIRWRPTPTGDYRSADPGQVIDDTKLKGADIESLVAKGALVVKAPKKGAADGSR